jgi:hypothetical protein
LYLAFWKALLAASRVEPVQKLSVLSASDPCIHCSLQLHAFLPIIWKLTCQTITAGPEYKQSKQKENRGARSDCNLKNCGVWSEVL